MATDTVEKLAKIKQEAHTQLRAAQDTEEVEKLNTRYLGRKADLTEILRSLKDLAPDIRGQVGKEANAVRLELEKEFSHKLSQLKQDSLNQKLKSERMDITVPGIPNKVGKLHPLTVERRKIEDIFLRMGFVIHEPFLIDNEYNNFTALNVPEGHPARDMWDTIRINDQEALIPHTSSMQNRIISGSEPPIRAIVPGQCFRNEATDARHEHSFAQIEGVYVDRGIKLSDLIGTLKQFLNEYFERPVPIKIQPTYFPFVEPGIEMMMECPVCRGEKPKDCGGCGGNGWMEVIPAGPIHPFVIKQAGLDPNVYSGFAWGLGWERLIMVKNNLSDVRDFRSGRLDFINQF